MYAPGFGVSRGSISIFCLKTVSRVFLIVAVVYTEVCTRHNIFEICSISFLQFQQILAGFKPAGGNEEMLAAFSELVLDERDIFRVFFQHIP